MRRRVLALAQIAPTLGDLAQNFAVHQEKIAESRAAGADLVIFPELSLTGYQLQDLAPEVAMRRTDPRLVALAKLTSGGPSAVVSFVESTDDHRLFAAAALLEGGEVRHVARKCYLPTYGLFDERRVLAAGELYDVDVMGRLLAASEKAKAPAKRLAVSWSAAISSCRRCCIAAARPCCGSSRRATRPCLAPGRRAASAPDTGSRAMRPRACMWPIPARPTELNKRPRPAHGPQSPDRS